MAKTGVYLRRLEMGEMVDGFSGYRESHEVHVLAVDDSLVDRKVIEKLLRITSCKVTAVESGLRALQILGLDEGESSVAYDLKVDLIITDYCMPGMTGYELLKKIKGSSAFRQIPVVIMSSENILARIDRCLEEGAEDFIVKPVKLSDVKRLKSCMFGEGWVHGEVANKRKLQESSDISLSESPSSSPLPSSFSPSPPSPPSSSRSCSSLPHGPCSPTCLGLDSPTRRFKMTNDN